MKVKYFFKFYKYYLQAEFWYLIGLITLLVIDGIFSSTSIPRLYYELPMTIVLVIGTIFFLYKSIQVLKYVPEHFSDYNRLTKIIQDEQKKDPNYKIKKSYLYTLCMTKCGQEIVDALVEDNNIEL